MSLSSQCPAGLSINSVYPSLGMPLFGLGTWKSEKGKVKAAVSESLNCGYVHIDAAFVYQNQEEVGEGIQEVIDSKKVSREDIWVTSKLWNYEHRVDRVVPAIDNTLSELKLDYIDQWLIHWPTAFNKNENLDLFPTITVEETGPNGEKTEKTITDVDHEASSLEEIWMEMEKVVQSGKVRTIGVSNFNVEEIERILKICTIKPAVNQIELHPYWNQAAMREYCASKGIAVVAYCPLGNLNPTDPDSVSPMKDEVILQLCKKYSKSPAQIIIRWHLQLGNIVIPKSVTPARIVENSQVYDFELTSDEMDTINQLGETKPKRYLNPGFRPGGVKVFEN